MPVDISRYLFQPEKRYSGVRMQQGRVILDSDWNESEQIDDEQARLTYLDLVCSKGTSNNGFFISNVEPVTITHGDDNNSPENIKVYSFSIASGSMFVGGLRFEISTDEKFLAQPDWLQIDSDFDSLPLVPVDSADGDDTDPERYDLVYLRCWEQLVTAVEDSELRERALGGPDTSARIRRMRRVEVLTNVPASCADAFAGLKERLLTNLPGDDSNSQHVFNDLDCSIRSKAKLSVSFDADGVNEDPCKPSVTAGYLGAENQAIRVQLTHTNRFIWGVNNASPLYRVQVIPHEGDNVKIRFLNLPLDQASQPLKGQAVEILPWSAMLPNQEKIAEPQGHLSTVSSSFDPEDNSIIIAKAVPDELIHWLDSHSKYFSERNPEQRKKYFYLRLWSGGSGLDDQPEHRFVAGTELGLAGTGLNVTFSDYGLPGDYWVIAARPHTPDVVVPWELMTESPPMGTRVFYAPLALIRWAVDDDHSVKATVQDCRTRFRPLCEIGGCTTVTVGDGSSNKGDFQSLEDAVAYLPDKGGLIQLLPGVHKVDVNIIGRKNITIRGCGKHTQVIPRESNRTGSVFYIADSDCIKLEKMDIVTFEGTAITLHGRQLNALKEIDIEKNRILAYENAIKVIQGVEVRIHKNRIRMLDKQGAGVAIVLWAEDSLIERNNIGVQPAESVPPPKIPGLNVPDPADPCADLRLIYAYPLYLLPYLNLLFTGLLNFFDFTPFKAKGGIVIAAGSERIEMLKNKIQGGASNGITLGGVIEYDSESGAEEDEGDNHVIDTTENYIQGSVENLSGDVQPDIVLAFVPQNNPGKIRNVVTESTGYYSIEADPARFGVEIVSPGYRIENITPQDSVEFGIHYSIRVDQHDQKPDIQLASIYEILIDQNDIAGMGLSGIGVPRLDASSVAVKNRAISILGNPIIGLTINRNHIQDCLRDQFNVSLSPASNRIGLGGVSLGFCEDVTIGNNKIEGNGVNHINPVCGLFVLFGGKIDIHHNHIFNNGLIDQSINPDTVKGIRGGIIVSGTSFNASDILPGLNQDFDSAGFAVRIHDNIVRQPLGQALRSLVLGPASICNNHLTTDKEGPDNLERFVGALLVLNAGNGKQLPTGLTLCNNNQIHLGPSSDSLAAQLIWSADDIGFDGNQSDAPARRLVNGDTASIFFNTILAAATLRACGSRFKEIDDKKGDDRPIIVSLMSISTLLNNTNNNQGDHCIFAFNKFPGKPPNFAGNQVRYDGRCKSRFDKSFKSSMARFHATPYR